MRLGALTLLLLATAAGAREPIIDMHLHARHADFESTAPPPMCGSDQMVWPGIIEP